MRKPVWRTAPLPAPCGRARRHAGGNDETLVSLVTSFQKLRLRWLRPLGNDWSLESVALLGPEAQTFEFVRGSEAYETRLGSLLREEVRREATDERHIGYRAGLDLLCARERYLYDVAFYPQGEEANAWWCAPGPYLETTARVGGLQVTAGLRADALFVNGDTVFAIDFRLAARQVLGTSTTLKAGTGLYSQPPTLRELNDESGGSLGPERSWRSSVGMLTPSLRADVGAFYKALDNLIVGREDRFYFFSGRPIERDFDTAPYANAGTGRTFGVEALLRYADDRTTAQLSATLSRSDRKGRDGVRTLFEYDQPELLNALASRELAKGWRLGTRRRYGSGNPDTPIANRVYNLEDRGWIPVYATGETERLKPFFSLDLRVDRTYDYGKEQPIEGLPPVPSFRFKGEC